MDFFYLAPHDNAWPKGIMARDSGTEFAKERDFRRRKLWEVPIEVDFLKIVCQRIFFKNVFEFFSKGFTVENFLNCFQKNYLATKKCL